MQKFFNPLLSLAANIPMLIISINFLSTSVAYSFVDFNKTPNCEDLTLQIEKKYKLPKFLLASLSRVEAGRVLSNGTTKGWPWALNHAGKGLFFENKIDALGYLKKATKAGSTNIDVGCMQLNFKWHRKAFDSITQMIEPTHNINYAAKFLLKLYERHGSWNAAIKHYHSNKPKFNKPYLRKVVKVWDLKKDDDKEDNPLLFADSVTTDLKKVVKPLISKQKVEPIVIFQDAKLFVEVSDKPNENIETLNFSSEINKTLGPEIPNDVPEFLRRKWSMVLALRPQLER